MWINHILVLYASISLAALLIKHIYYIWFSIYDVLVKLRGRDYLGSVEMDGHFVYIKSYPSSRERYMYAHYRHVKD